MDVILIRHTTPRVEKGICYGQTDLELADTFMQELEVLKDKLPKQCDIIYSSPLKRCKELANQLGEGVRTDNRLMEMDFGNWEMKLWNDIPQDELNPWMADFVNVGVPGGESFQEMIARVDEFLAEMLARDHKRILIVSHAGVIRAALGFFLGIPPENVFRLNIDYGGVSEVSVKRGMYHVKYINR